MRWRAPCALVLGLAAAFATAACGLVGDGEDSGAGYDGARICRQKSPFEGMPAGCPFARREGTDCPSESEGTRCFGSLYKVGSHYRQEMTYCEDGVWVDWPQPCSNECTALGPNAVELPDDCDERPLVVCDNPSMSAILSAELEQCEVDIFANVIQVEFVDGCARRVSANRPFGDCVIHALSAKRWNCSTGFQCGTLSRVLL